MVGWRSNFVTRCHNEWFFTRAMYRRVLGTGLFLFWYLLLSALKLTGASPCGICIIWGLGISLAVYLTAGISGTSEPRGHRPVAVCLLPGQVVPYIVAQVAGAFGGAVLHPVRNLKRCIIWCAAAKPAAGQYIQYLPGA